ncbi:hypothetical protein ACIREO_35425 [Streptomyces sp. NPDC102441]|uniref:hypothetical protein n=1 Tax=Streptomyces sp. NPDC102441 TaxID=3366176 RepID=UPI0038091327
MKKLTGRPTDEVDIRSTVSGPAGPTVTEAVLPGAVEPEAPPLPTPIHSTQEVVMKVADTALNGRGPTVRADKIGRWLLVLATLSTVGAFFHGIAPMMDAPDSRIWVEGWRTSAYLVFAGLFAILAAAPRAHRGLWELIIGQKTALVVIAAVVGDVNEARQSGLIDLGLVVVVVAAYVLCRGWYGWRTSAAEPTGGQPSAGPAA